MYYQPILAIAGKGDQHGSLRISTIITLAAEWRIDSGGGGQGKWREGKPVSGLL